MEVSMMEWKNERVCDVLNLILGAFLVVSPWMFSFAAGTPSQNAIITGFVIVVLSIAALSAFAQWEEWLNLLAGLWAIVSPWVLGFATGTAMQVHVIVGLIVAVIAAIELWMEHRGGHLAAH
jgi:SPW repeat-containing protein